MQIEIIVHTSVFRKICKQDTPIASAINRHTVITWGMYLQPKCVLLSCSDAYMTNAQVFIIPGLLRYLQKHWNTPKQQCSWHAVVENFNGIAQTFGRLEVSRKYNAFITTDTEDLCLN